MRRQTATATTGMVATQHPLAVEAALEMLSAGGSAADAAVAAAAVLTVVDPGSTSLGGDMFALYWPAGETRPVALESSGCAPALLTSQALIAAGHRHMPLDGPWSISVPGAPAGWAALLDRFGNLEVARVLAPAIRAARDGFRVSPIVAAEWATDVAKLRSNAAATESFLIDGRAPDDGEAFAIPDLASTLERFARDGDAPFYRGEIAERIAGAVEALGGPLRAQDLADWSGPAWVEPITARFRGRDIYELPPPVQSLVALEALRIYEGVSTTTVVDEDHAAIESIKLAYSDANRYVADPAFVEVPVQRLLADAHVDQQRARISASAALAADIGQPSDTVYVAVADDEGGACSFIQSIFHGFGSGVAVPGTGLILQNRASGFRLEPGHANRPEPGKRPLHTIMPAMVAEAGSLRGCLGVVGGFMQPQGQLQVLRNIFDRGMDAQEAVDAPRFRVYRGHAVAVEDDYDPHVVAGLRDRGHDVRALEPLEGGGAQLVLRDERGYRGGSDRRKDGYAAGR